MLGVAALARSAAAQDVATGGTAALGGLATQGQMLAPPSVLPATGFVSGDNGSPASVRLGDLGAQVGQTFMPQTSIPPAPVAGPAWLLVPSLGATEELTDNANTSGIGTGKKRGDLITTIQPGIAISGDTPRAQVNLAYDPQIYLYADQGGQDRVDHEFNGRALLTVLPQTLFLDLRGQASQQSITGGAGPLSSTTLSSNDTEQDVSISASPYLVHRFGGAGSGEIGYSVTRSLQSANQRTALPPGPLIATPFGLFDPLTDTFVATPATNQNTTTQNAHAAFTTGEDFGRYNGTALLSGTTYSGGGVLSDARRDIATIDNGYAITRTITLLATLGWENIRYAGTSPVHIDDAIWDFGTRLRPNADSTITLRYGHHDGLDSLTVDGALSPTPRTRVYIRYSEGLTTNQEELQNALATTDLDALGNPVDHGTGAPIYQASNFFGAQDGLERLRRFSLSGAWQLGRDTITLTLENDRSTVLSQASALPSAASVSSTGTFGSITWQHELSPLLTATGFFQYGQSRSLGQSVAGEIVPGQSLSGQPGTTQDLLVTTASLSYALGPTVTTSVEVSHTQTSGAGTGAAGRQNILLVSLVKTF